MTPVLQLAGVTKKYRSGDEQVHVLVDLDFALRAGEFVDSHSSAQILNLLRSLSDEDGAAVVVVTHDQAAARYGARELHLDDGRTYAAPIEGR